MIWAMASRGENPNSGRIIVLDYTVNIFKYPFHLSEGLILGLTAVDVYLILREEALMTLFCDA